METLTSVKRFLARKSRAIDTADVDFSFIQELKAEVKQLLGPAKHARPNPAAEWRLRVKRQYAIDGELKKIGPLAVLCCGGLLYAFRNGYVQSVERFSRSKETMINSPLFGLLDRYGKANLLRSEFQEYVRIEQGLQTIGTMICLSVPNMEDSAIANSFTQLKVWACNHAFRNDNARLDDVLRYMKWLAKACQAAFLRTKVPKRPEFSGPEDEKVISPFAGQLSYISDIIKSGRRKETLPLEQARSLAQIGGASRALPYPSDSMVKESIKDAIEVTISDFKVSREHLKTYRKGLNAVHNRLGPLGKPKSHVSLTAKGSYEVGRSKGGRSAILVRAARATTDKPLIFDEETKQLTKRFDCFGFKYIDPATYAIAQNLLKTNEYKRQPKLGDILYVSVEELEGLWNETLNAERAVPLHLGDILNATASKLIMVVGHYSHSNSLIHGLLTFSSKRVRFVKTGVLKNKAEVSIESGLKTRLITSAQAAFQHLGQLPSNTMRAYLSKDPFCRVGFEESDKLWEVLKTYKKISDKKSSS